MSAVSTRPLCPPSVIETDFTGLIRNIIDVLSSWSLKYTDLSNLNTVGMHVSTHHCIAVGMGKAKMHAQAFETTSNKPVMFFFPPWHLGVLFSSTSVL